MIYYVAARQVDFALPAREGRNRPPPMDREPSRLAAAGMDDAPRILVVLTCPAGRGAPFAPFGGIADLWRAAECRALRNMYRKSTVTVIASSRMKKLMAATLIGASLLTAARPLMALDAFQQNTRLGRGVNILGWDALWQDPARGQFQDIHFKLIREAGFQHVRINLHPLRDGRPDAAGKLRGEFFKTMDWAVDQALANGLLVILDYHDDLAISPDPAGQKLAFLASWKAIAEHCQDRSDTVLFEILNEPAPKFTHATWAEYWRAALALIRQSNPKRTVILGPAQWNGVGELDHLELPADDRNIIVTVHYYNPFAFTHQGTPWTAQKEKLGVTWMGTEGEVKAVEQELAKVSTWAKQNNRPIYIGEFGAYEKADLPSRIRWTASVARAFEQHGWSWGYWQFADNFAVFDMRTQKWVTPIRDALIPKK